MSRLGMYGTTSYKKGIEMFKEGFLDKTQKKGTSSDAGSSSLRAKSTKEYEYTEQQKMEQIEKNRSSNERKQELSKKFTCLEGNCESLNDAEVICLGERHSYEHYKQIIEFIEFFAKDGDILLVEAASKNDKLDEKPYLKNAFLTRGGDSIELSKKVQVYGWEDKEAYNRHTEILYKIDMLEQKKSHDKNRNEIDRAIESANKLSMELATKRDIALIATVNEKKASFPNKKIFIIAGVAHFTNNPKVPEELNRYRFTALVPISEPSKEDLNQSKEILQQQVRARLQSKSR